MENLFTMIYPIVGIIGVLGYIPQIKELLKRDCDTSGISLQSWYMWIFASYVTYGYAQFAVKDAMFAITALVTAILITAVTGLILLRRHENEIYAFLGGRAAPLPAYKSYA